MQPRKFVTIERSAPHKQPPRASYDSAGHRDTYDTNFHGDIIRYSSNTNLLKSRNDFVEPKLKYIDLHKSPSETNLKTREQHVRGNIIRRRGDGMVSNLKSQLQNLKMEVSKLMNKDSDAKLYTSRVGMRTSEDERDSDQRLSLGGYAKDISDTISVTSEKIIDEPLRRLESKFGSTNYDHAHYMELQNDLLKTQLRNLKNKYNSTKQEWRQKCQALQRKNQYLEISLRRSQQTLSECKKALQVEVQTIKFQLTRKLQQQYQEEQKKSQRSIPVRDQYGQNELVQEKLNKLYEELHEKSKIISSINIDLNEAKGIVEKKTFELKKEIEKNSELSKQLQFAKRENSRNKNLLQTQVAKKVELIKTVDNLRQKVNELTKELNLQKQIVNGSQQLENKYSTELEQLKQVENRLTEENYELQNQIRKLRQLNDSHETEIKHLKATINDFTTQIEQVSKNARLEREHAIQIEERYRKMLDQAKQNSQKQLYILQQEFDTYKQSARQNAYRQEMEQIELKSKQKFDLKQKDRQISRWKAQYKMLKIKFEEHFSIENAKKQEIQSYYRNYKQYKSKNKILEMRNKILEQSANDYIEKIQKVESANLEEKVVALEKINTLTLQNNQHARKIEYLEEELNQLKAAIEAETERANKQQSLRQQLQQKVLNLDLQQGNEQLMSIIERMKKRMSDQDDKINKYIKEMKNKDNLIKELKKEIRTVLETQQIELQKFRNKEIADAIHQIQTKTFSSFEELKNQSRKQINIEMENNNELIEENAKMKGEIGKLTKQLIDLKEELKQISRLYNEKSVEVEQLKDKNQLQAENHSAKLDEIQKIKSQAIKNLQAQIISKNQEIQNYRLEIKKMLTLKGSTADEQKFDEALRTQIQASKKLREELNKKNEQVYRLRDSYSVLKTQLDNLKSQSDIAKLKFISDKKNLQVQYDVQLQSIKSQLSLQQKKVSSLEQKIKLVLDQNKKKDNFIQAYIMGKKLPINQKELVAAFLKQYELSITGKDISEKLQSQSQQLEKMANYNFTLMKEIAELKQKLLMYEAISVDNSQSRQQNFYDVQSPQSRRNLMSSQRVQRRVLE